MPTFVDEEKINCLLDDKIVLSPEIFHSIIEKSFFGKTLSMNDVALLIKYAENDGYRQMIFEKARELKQKVYGDRIVLFVPLYLGNDCLNKCRYCAFDATNSKVNRRTLGMDEIDQQVSSILSQGHKRVVIVYGDHPRYGGERIAEDIKRIYQVKIPHGEIRRINVNAAPMDKAGFEKLKNAGIGTYQVFQETYHQESYQYYHPPGTPKSDYHKRLYALDQAFNAGIDDVGIGVLLGLYRWQFEILGLMAHVHYLEEKFNVGPHTISFPRIKRATGVDEKFPYLVSDDDLKTIIAILRLAVPYTGLILTARENSQLRNELIDLGVSQIDGGSRIELGGYGEESKIKSSSQFELGDNRSLAEIIDALVNNRQIPSFCTGCYRKGRTGEHFMEFAIPGFIHDYCAPNALFTFMEYLTHFAPKELQQKGHALIRDKMVNIGNEVQKEQIAKKLNEISSGSLEDFYF